MPDDLYAFSMTSLMDIMKEFSDISIPRVAIGYILMVCSGKKNYHECLQISKWRYCSRHEVSSDELSSFQHIKWMDTPVEKMSKIFLCPFSVGVTFKMKDFALSSVGRNSFPFSAHPFSKGSICTGKQTEGQ